MCFAFELTRLINSNPLSQHYQEQTLASSRSKPLNIGWNALEFKRICWKFEILNAGELR